MNRIKELMLGTTVELKLNQGCPHSFGVLSWGWPFWVPFCQPDQAFWGGHTKRYENKIAVVYPL
jgi:hypothetical protein